MRKNPNVLPRPEKAPCFVHEGVAACLKNYGELEEKDQVDFLPVLQRVLHFRAKRGTEQSVLDFLQDRFESTRDKRLFTMLGEAILHHATELMGSDPKLAAPYIDEVAKGAAGTPLGQTAEDKHKACTGLGQLQARQFATIHPGLPAEIESHRENMRTVDRNKRIENKLFGGPK